MLIGLTSVLVLVMISVRSHTCIFWSWNSPADAVSWASAPNLVRFPFALLLFYFQSTIALSHTMLSLVSYFAFTLNLFHGHNPNVHQFSCYNHRHCYLRCVHLAPAARRIDDLPPLTQATRRMDDDSATLAPAAHQLDDDCAPPSP